MSARLTALANWLISSGRIAFAIAALQRLARHSLCASSRKFGCAAIRRFSILVIETRSERPFFLLVAKARRLFACTPMAAIASVSRDGECEDARAHIVAAAAARLTPLDAANRAHGYIFFAARFPSPIGVCFVAATANLLRFDYKQQTFFLRAAKMRAATQIDDARR